MFYRFLILPFPRFSMSIQRLPEFLINKLKAGEIVERPASVVKELVENSLDAGANEIVIDLHDGWKKLIKVEDDGEGIATDDIDLVIERYATSKIASEDDLYSISSYGFRGEAMASISEVSKMTIQTKRVESTIGQTLTKVGSEIHVRPMSFAWWHGTTVIVEDLFFNTPVRQKFLKSSQTEYFYCYDLFLNFALIHRDKHWVLKKDGKIVFDLAPASDLLTRFGDIFKKEWQSNVRILDFDDKSLRMYGVLSDSSLTFGSPENMRIFVNARPVQDRVLKKALVTAYERQIAPGTYPLALLFVDIDPELVDVNVHPRKLEVRFADPGSIYQAVHFAVKKSLGDEKIIDIPRDTLDKIASTPVTHIDNNFFHNPFRSGQGQRIDPLPFTFEEHVSVASSGEGTLNIQTADTHYTVVGQMRNMYIILQADDGMYMIDQHALAERIAFEKMKKKAAEEWLTPEALLQPVTIEFPKTMLIEDKIEELQQLGFEMAAFGENKLIVHAVPKVFVDYQIDLETLLNITLHKDPISFETILDELYAMKACKASIKAGEKLSLPEMQRIVQDGFEHIDGMFVCQHGRPFFVKMGKSDIDGLFDR